MSYRVNLDFPTNRATIHTVNSRGTCRPRRKRSDHGGWVGPFATKWEAERIAWEYDLQIHLCRICCPWREPYWEAGASSPSGPALPDRLDEINDRRRNWEGNIPSSRDWDRLVQSLGHIVDRPDSDDEIRRQEVNLREQSLTQAAADLTLRWAILEEVLLDIQSSDYNEQAVQKLRQDARESRIAALSNATRLQLGDINFGIYQPMINIFKEMANTEIEVYDAILKVCDSRDPNDLEVALASVRYCLSLGEKAIMMMPELAENRRVGEEGCKGFWEELGACGCTVLLVTVVLSVVVSMICG